MSPVANVFIWSAILLLCIYGVARENTIPPYRIGFLVLYLLSLVVAFILYV